MHVVSETRKTARCHLTLIDHGVTFHFLRREPYHLAPYYFYATGVARTRRLLHALKPDLVVGFGTDEPYAWEAAHNGFPFAIYMQGVVEELAPYLDWPSFHVRAARWMEHRALLHAAGVVAESAFVQKWASTRAPQALVTTIPNCLRDGFVNIQPARPDHGLDLWCVGELSRLKNPEIVLQAFQAAAVPAARLHFAGTGPLQRKLKTRIHQFGLADRCDLHGWMDPSLLAQALARATALVHASWMDSSPNVAVEAHAAGIPVIATAVGGIPSRVHHEVDGLLVPPGDVAAMASAMRRLLGSPETTARMGAAGRERVLREHDPARVAQLHAEFYERLIASQPTLTPEGRGRSEE